MLCTVSTDGIFYFFISGTITNKVNGNMLPFQKINFHLLYLVNNTAPLQI